jgi:hypothetical protein
MRFVGAGLAPPGVNTITHRREAAFDHTVNSVQRRPVKHILAAA